MVVIVYQIIKKLLETIRIILPYTLILSPDNNILHKWFDIKLEMEFPLVVCSQDNIILYIINS